MKIWEYELSTGDGNMATRHIEIAEMDFTRLQAIAVPFVDTPGTVLGKLLDHWGADNQPPARRMESARSSNVSIYGPDAIPPLTHAKVMSASFGGQAPSRMTWDALVRMALVRTKSSYGTVDEIRRVSGANVISGGKDDDGYKPVEGQGFSYQGVSAEDAVKIVIRCARALRSSLQIEFVWRDKKGAHQPGERGRIEFSPR